MLCPYHEDSLGWYECSWGWVESTFIAEYPEAKLCDVKEARKATDSRLFDYFHYDD